ncbi:EAL domain-containing protein [Zoogloea sp.]|uniref:EAL domain-containing protein n=1 Tax=Zoogloea sp. TaxID=49181 RepID=UPI002614503B|nr:EAL domain-containing protein [Zoogloea sp.]MDD3354553.1 EAL domain-containing protein [Zoogloea sp.]
MPFSERARILTGILAAYTLSGLLALHLAIPPGYIAPLYPPAGIALACVLIYGGGVWPAILLGAFTINIEAVLRTGFDGWAWVMPLAVSISATLQALLGARLARRWVRFPNPLDSISSVFRFLFIAGPLSCTIGASFSVGSLVLTGALPLEEAAFSWWSWWAGDAVGVLLAAPLTFAFFAHPRDDWRSRRLSLTIPLVVALGLLALFELQVSRWDNQRLQSRFEKDARNLSSLMTTRFSDYLDILQSTERIMVAAPELNGQGFEHFAQTWLGRSAGLQAIGWIPRVGANDLEKFEHSVRTGEGWETYQVRDRSPDNQLIPVRSQGEYFPILYIAPKAGNTRALGINTLSIPNSAEAVRRTWASRQAAATQAFELTQETQRKLGIVVYQRTTPPPGHNKPDGLVFVALRIEDAISSILKHHGEMGIAHCITEITPENLRGRRLSGHPHCPDNQDLGGAWGVKPLVETFDFAGRTWTLSFVATPTYINQHRGWASWTLMVTGLMGTGLLGAFLLITTGHAQRTEAVVRQRTLELADANRRLGAQQAMLTHAERIARLGSWEAHPETGRAHWSVELHHILGIPPGPDGKLEDLIQAITPEDRPRLENALREIRGGLSSTSLDLHLPGTEEGLPQRTVHFTLEASHDDAGTLRGTAQDVTASRATEAHIHYLAHYDVLTGLPNRTLWVNRAEQSLAIAHRHQSGLGVLFLDLDNFKKINDTLGHPTGDRLLSAAAHRLTQCLRNEDVLARIGGDEFVVLLPQLQRDEDAAVVARKLIASLTRPFEIDGQELTVSTSIGIALYPSNGTDVDMLLKHADTAMYDAKNGGRNDFRFFTQAMNSRAYSRLMLENALRRALERQELELDYQPQWAMPMQRLVGVEALVRWRHPERGRIAPNEFIPIAEESGLIHAIGDWVLEEACRQQALWQAAGLPPLTIAVNVSALQLRRADFVARVRQAFERQGVTPTSFELELTESALMQPGPEMEDTFATLRAMGLGLSLDDFGTGYSSLSHLKRLPITRLKIDRSFVEDLPGDIEDAAIAAATLSMARDLGLEVVAEGVETEAQRDFLLARQCPMMQGYLLGRPQSAAEITALLRVRSTPAGQIFS